MEYEELLKEQKKKVEELEAQCHQEQEEYLRLINKYLDTRQPIAHKIKDDSSFSFIRGQEDAPSTSFSLKKLQPVQALRDILCQNNPTAKCFITTLPKEKKDALSFQQTQVIHELANFEQTLKDAITFKDETVVTDENGAIIVTVQNADTFVDMPLQTNV